MRISPAAAIFSTTICLLAMQVPACAPGIQVHTASLPTAPFGQYRTFSFGSTEHTPSGYEATARSIEVQRRMGPIIAKDLERKGYVLSGSSNAKEPNLVVRYSSGRREREPQRNRPTHPGWLDENEDVDFVEGSLVIDVFDGSDNGQIWHGASRTEINPDQIDDRLLERSVTALLAKFPMRHTSE